MIEQKYNSTHPRIISVYVSQSEELMMNSKKRLAAFIAIISLVFSAMTLATPPAAHAVGCYGDWCSGQDADATGCSADAVTTQVYNNKEFSLHVRWSPTCKTNWARIFMHSPGWIKCTRSGYLKAVQDTGYTQQIFFDTVCAPVVTVHYTPMIYSPAHKVRAVFVDQNNFTYSTPWS